jgi:hypothetical protein
MPTYPIIRYPVKVAEQLRKMQSAAQPEGKSPSPATQRKFRAPPKPQYLTEFPWYLTIVGLLAVVAVIYRFANMPIMGLLALAGIGFSIKYLIDRQQWSAQVRAAKKKARSIAPQKINNADTVPYTPIAYPDWSQITNLQTSSIPSEAQIGISEKYFLEYLRKYFPKAALGCKHPHPDWDEEWWYSSDIEIILRGLGLQLEIDEPYEGKEGRPHHCCDEPGDKRRDAFFLGRDWIIIRFAERQVVEEPIACCRLVAQVVADLTGDKSYLRSIGHQPPITKISAWTKQQAKRMFKTNFRYQYLKPAGLLR